MRPRLRSRSRPSRRSSAHTWSHSSADRNVRGSGFRNRPLIEIGMAPIVQLASRHGGLRLLCAKGVSCRAARRCRPSTEQSPDCRRGAAQARPTARCNSRSRTSVLVPSCARLSLQWLGRRIPLAQVRRSECRWVKGRRRWPQERLLSLKSWLRLSRRICSRPEPRPPPGRRRVWRRSVR